MVICGDIFDSWRSHRTPAELVNKTISWFKEFKQNVYAIPGNHDLPYHRYDLDWKSPYGTLVRSGAITPIIPNIPNPINLGEALLYGFPWGFPASDSDMKTYSGQNDISIAVVHDYCYTEEFGHYPNVDPDKHAKAHRKNLKKFNLALFGDNHVPFEYGNIVNVGNFLVRSIVEVSQRKPTAVLVMKHDGIVFHQRIPLDTSGDRFLLAKVQKGTNTVTNSSINELISDLAANPEATADFKEILLKLISSPKVTENIRVILHDLLGD